MSDWIRLSSLDRLRDEYVKRLSFLSISHPIALKLFDDAMAAIVAEEDVSSVNEDKREQFRYHNTRSAAFQEASAVVMEIGKCLWAKGNEQAVVYKSIAEIMIQRTNEETEKARKIEY